MYTYVHCTLYIYMYVCTYIVLLINLEYVHMYNVRGADYMYMCIYADLHILWSRVDVSNAEQIYTAMYMYMYACHYGNAPQTALNSQLLDKLLSKQHTYVQYIQTCT